MGFPCDFIFELSGVASFGDQCGTFRADVAFATISSLSWMASAILNVYMELSLARKEEEAERRELQKQQEMQQSDSDV